MVSCLIAEDEPITAMALADAAEEAGFDVRGPFGRCSVILESLAHSSPDAAILDAGLRDGPSHEIAQELRRRAIPFVICSGHRRSTDLDIAFADAPWVEKPATPTEVLAALRSAMSPAPPALKPQQARVHTAPFERTLVAVP